MRHLTSARSETRHATSWTQGTSPASPTVGETVETLGTTRDTGLAGAEAARRLAAQGPNEVPEKRSHPVLRLARKFWGVSAWMIELIAVLSLVLHKDADFGIALGLLLANALLGFFQEQRASAAVKALRSKLQVTARVLRGRELASCAGARARHRRRRARARWRLRPRRRAALRRRRCTSTSRRSPANRTTSTRAPTGRSTPDRPCATERRRAWSWPPARARTSVAPPSSSKARTRSSTSRRSPRGW